MDKKCSEVHSTGSGSQIGDALEMLRNELTLLQEQDILLLKQLMNVHYSIRMLKRKLSRRTNSFTTLVENSKMANDFTYNSKVSTKYCTLPARTSLSRVKSEPARSLIYQRSLSVTTEEEDGEDEEEEEIAYASTDSEATDPLMVSLNIDPEMSELLTDMPKSLRRKYLNSLNHNSHLLGRLPSNDIDKPVVKSCNSSTNHSCDALKNGDQDNISIVNGDINHRHSSLKKNISKQTSNFDKSIPVSSQSNIRKSPNRKLCRTKAIHDDTITCNSLRGDEVNVDIMYDSDSSGGIEITAL